MILYNQTQFIIAGFPLSSVLQVYVGVALLLVYIISLLGNILTIAIVSLDINLKAPMYFFLRSLATSDIFFISSTTPKFLSILLNNNKDITLNGCLLQLYFYVAIGCTEFNTLALLSVDRFLAICYPLQYNTIMSGSFCWCLAICMWIVGILENIPAVVLMTRLQWCSRIGVIDHFFCDGSALLNLSCSDTQFVEKLFFIVTSFAIISSLIISILSYVFIISSVCSISSPTGRSKTFSTCSSHFVAVLLAYGSCLFIYVHTAQSVSYSPAKIVAIFNSFLSPMLHPFIYSLRNKVALTALNRMFSNKLCCI